MVCPSNLRQWNVPRRHAAKGASSIDIFDTQIILNLPQVDMKSELQNGPMSIAVAAGNNCWRYYESGILSEENNCPGGLDHGVVIVGLDEKSGQKPYWII